MSFLDAIGNIFKPISDTIDELHVGEDEKMALENQMAAIQKDVAVKMMDLQVKLSESAANVAVAETKSDSLFTRTYRPVIISGMFLMMVANYFGILPVPLPDMFVTIFGSAFGVIGIGRSVEKVFRVKK